VRGARGVHSSSLSSTRCLPLPMFGVGALQADDRGDKLRFNWSMVQLVFDARRSQACRRVRHAPSLFGD